MKPDPDELALVSDICLHRVNRLPADHLHVCNIRGDHGTHICYICDYPWPVENEEG